MARRTHTPGGPRTRSGRRVYHHEHTGGANSFCDLLRNVSVNSMRSLPACGRHDPRSPRQGWCAATPARVRQPGASHSRTSPATAPALVRAHLPSENAVSDCRLAEVRILGRAERMHRAGRTLSRDILISVCGGTPAAARDGVASAACAATTAVRSRRGKRMPARQIHVVISMQRDVR